VCLSSREERGGCGCRIYIAEEVILLFITTTSSKLQNYVFLLTHYPDILLPAANLIPLTITLVQSN